MLELYAYRDAGGVTSKNEIVTGQNRRPVTIYLYEAMTYDWLGEDFA